MAKKIVITTFGSLGDLHPYIAIALGLQERGHTAVLATSAFYREKIQALGLGFSPVRPDHPPVEEMPDLVRQLMDLRKGTERVVREWIMPRLRDSYGDTLAATEGADFLISHPLTFTTQMVAEKLGVPWASSMLQPIGFFSAYDPPVIPVAAWLRHLHFLGPRFYRQLFRLVRWKVHRWTDPVHELREELGLARTNKNPLLEGQHSPHLVLALFSRLLAAPQPDWPPKTVVTGFPFFDADAQMPAELRSFLANGEAPIVFTLGSSAVYDAGNFYEISAEAAFRLKARAVFLTGRGSTNKLKTLPSSMIALDYSPFSNLFPHAAAIVHQGGVGTTAQAMRAGRPMLIMPYSHDQPDNALRMQRLGIGRAISRRNYSAARAAKELKVLLDDPQYAQRAQLVASEIQMENGVASACNAIERVL